MEQSACQLINNRVTPYLHGKTSLGCLVELNLQSTNGLNQPKLSVHLNHFFFHDEESSLNVEPTLRYGFLYYGFHCPQIKAKSLFLKPITVIENKCGMTNAQSQIRPCWIVTTYLLGKTLKIAVPKIAYQNKRLKTIKK